MGLPTGTRTQCIYSCCKVNYHIIFILTPKYNISLIWVVLRLSEHDEVIKTQLHEPRGGPKCSAHVRLPDVLKRQELSLNLLSKLMSLILEKQIVVLEYLPASLKILE